MRIPESGLTSLLRLNRRPPAALRPAGACHRTATSTQAFAHCTKDEMPVFLAAGALAPHAKEVMELT
jgi:hypothetical protein